MKGRAWTDAEDAELRRLYPHYATDALCRVFRRGMSALHKRARKLGLQKSEEFLASEHAGRLNGTQGHEYRFPKGNVPANKGTRRPGYAPGRMAATQFRKGTRPHNWVPVGTENADADGYIKRKIRDDAPPGMSRFNWRYVHLLTWEQVHGPVPRGYNVAFVNGDRSDVRIENLELISDAEKMRRNTIHRLPPELVEVCQARGRIKRLTNRREREREEQG